MRSTKQKNEKKQERQKREADFVISREGGVFEHVSDDLEDQDHERSDYDRDAEQD